MRFVANQKILHYRVVDPIGAGGMGEVYRAVHETLGRVVALKILTSNRGGGTDFVAHFFEEAKILANLQHANIATLYDFFEYDGLLCMAMEFIGGRGLDEIICESEGLPLHEAVPIFKDIVRAVGYIHECGIQHRDIKPANIRIDQRGIAKLLDFGIAQDAISGSTSKSDRVLGTLQYMAPEQLSGKKSDHRVDIWALGVLFYEMLMGRLPFDKETVAEYLDEVKNSKRSEAIIRLAPLSESVKTLISHCLQRSPARRYQSIRQLEHDLYRLQFAQAPSPVADSYRKQALKWLRVSRTSKIAGLTAFGIGAVLLSLHVSRLHLARDETAMPRQLASSEMLKHLDNEGQSIIEAENRVPFRISIAGDYPVAEVYRGNEHLGVTPFEGLAPIGARLAYTLKHPDYKEKPVEFIVNPIERRNHIFVELKRLPNGR